MKKIYMRHLEKELDSCIPSAFPGFHRHKVKIARGEKQKSTIQTSEINFVKKIDEKMFCILSVIPHQKQERFMLEVGWSTLGRFPWDVARPTSFIKGSYSEFTLDECMVDYGDIYRSNNPDALAHIGWDVWKCSVNTSHPDFIKTFISEDSMPLSEEIAAIRVKAAVTNLIHDITRDVIPYLDKRIQAYKTVKR